MPRIDAHQHFWQYSPERHSWISNEMAAIKGDRFPEDVQEHLVDHKIDGVVAVQVDQSEEENRFLLDLAGKHSFIKGIVGWVDLQAKDIEDRLDWYKTLPNMKGFRHILQAESERDYMLRPAFMQGIKELQRHGFTYDILIFPDQLIFTRTFVEAFPNQPFIIDHLAKPLIKTGEIKPWAIEIKELARNENVWCKVSGMITEADWHGWKYEDFVPYLDTVVEAFGVRRMIYGSDWPVCQLAGGYGPAIEIVNTYFSQFSENEQLLFWGNNAVEFYNLKV